MQVKNYPLGTVLALLETDMVTPQTRAALIERLEKETTATPRFFDDHAFDTLRAACARLLPQPERSPLQTIDLAGVIDERLAKGEGDGWRYDVMPPDGEAFRSGLRGLDESARDICGRSFRELDRRRRI